MTTKKVILISAATFAAGELLLAFPLILFLILWFGGGWWAIKCYKESDVGFYNFEWFDLIPIIIGGFFILPIFSLVEGNIKEYLKEFFLVDKLPFEFQSPFKKKDTE